MIYRMPFDPVITGFAHLSCAGTDDAEALALFPTRAFAQCWKLFHSLAP